MTEDRSVPILAARNNRSSGPSATEQVAPGLWWRMTGSYKDFSTREAPDHGLIFLISDIRIIDGDIHTVVLHEHPKFGVGTFLILLEDLLREFTFEPDGEVFRSQEFEALMSSIQEITKEISNPPDDETLMASLPSPDVPDEEGAENSDTAQVPEVLLPSQDVNAAQAKIERALAVMEARRDWVDVKTTEMQSRMNLVSRYQTEKVAIGLAGVSEQRKFAESMLENVQTMRLWLGEDQAFQTLVEGHGAEKDEPLHFMQRMLYLDEEIFTHSRLDGLTADDMWELPQILSENPDLIQRMMPHPRCVVITRVRREARRINYSDDIFSILQNLAKSDADKEIQILIRNGDQVHLVTTDEITSRAERLFPSRKEIDAIFTESDYRKETRMITPHDIEYSDKRANHDSRALFYRRVLLIIWGLAEREGIFGEFIGQGVNWLEETVHSKAFRFIHDEEDVIGDGRLSIVDFLNENEKSVRPKSRILSDWNTLVNPTTAEHLYDGSEASQFRYIKVALDEDIGISLVEKRGNDLTVKCPVTRHVRTSGEDISYKTPVKVSWKESSWGKFRSSYAEGYICLDGLHSSDLKYYFNSRIHRQHYLKYLHLFDRAISILEAEEAHCSPIEEQICKEADVTPQIAGQAIRLWRGGAKWKLPIKKDMTKIARLAGLISGKPEDIFRDALYVDLRVNGILDVGQLSIPDALGFRTPFSEVKSYIFNKRHGWVEKTCDLIAIDVKPDASSLRICNAVSSELMDEISLLPPVMQDPAAVDRLMCQSVSQVDHDFISTLIEGGPELNMKNLIDSCIGWSQRNSHDIVVEPYVVSTLGYSFFEHGGNRKLFRFELYVDPILQVLNLGGEDLIRSMCKKLYKHSGHAMEANLSTLKKMRDDGNKPFGVRAVRLHSSTDITEDSSYGSCKLKLGIQHNTWVLRTNEDGLHFHGSLREYIASIDLRNSYFRKPVDVEELSELMKKVRFSFLPGGEDLLRKMSGFHTDMVDLSHDEKSPEDPS